MATYFKSVLTVLFAGGIATLVTPEGEMKRGVRFAISLAVLVVLLSPLAEGWPDGFFDVEADGAGEKAAEAGTAFLAEAEEEALAEGLAVCLASKFGLSSDSLAVTLTAERAADGQTVRIRTLTLHLYGRGMTADAVGMRALLLRETGVECEVLYHGE